MTHVIKSDAGNRILQAVLTDGEVDIGDIEDIEVELEEARAYACRLLDRLWSLGHELERARAALDSEGRVDLGENPSAEGVARFKEWWGRFTGGRETEE